MNYYTLTYTMEQVRFLWVLVGRITDESDKEIFKDEIAYDHNLEDLKQWCSRYLPNMTGSHLMKSGESWRTFILP